MKLRLFLTVAFFWLSLGCAMEDFEEFKELGGLRIVGVEASSSEIDGASSGTVNVTLTPYISDINAAGRNFQVSVTSCLDPSFAQTGQLGCSSPISTSYPDFNTSSLAATSYTGAMPSVVISIPDPASQIAGFSEQLRYNGVPYYVLFTLTSGSEVFSFVKQLRITDRGALNSNPVINQVLYDGEALLSAPSTSGTLNMTFTAGGSAETYTELTSDGTTQVQTESYLISWFASPGEISSGRVLAGEESKLETAEPSVLIGVVRDRRGGTDVVIFTP